MFPGADEWTTPAISSGSASLRRIGLAGGPAHSQYPGGVGFQSANGGEPIQKCAPTIPERYQPMVWLT